MSSISIEDSISTYKNTVETYVKSMGAYRVYAYTNTHEGGIKHTNYKFCCRQSDEEGVLSSPYCENVLLIWDKGQWINEPILNNENEQESNDVNINYNVNDDSTSFIDPRDGKKYRIVKIGNQVWMAENLVFKAKSGNYWAYNNEEKNAETEGYFYDFNAAKNSCPPGWHLPSDNDWKTLEMVLGMSQIDSDRDNWRGTNEGGKLKETGIIHWKTPNDKATDEFGFTAIPNGYRHYQGDFPERGEKAHFWTSTEINSERAWSRILTFDYGDIARHNNNKDFGFNVRCIKY